MSSLVDLVVSLKCDAAEFRQGMTQAASSLDGLQSKIKEVAGAIAGFLAVREIVGEFQDAIKSTQDWAFEIDRLSKITGQSAQASSVLAVAAKEQGVGIDVVEGAMGKLARTLAINEKAVVNVAGSIRNANGQLLPMDQILGKVVTGLETFRAGADRDAAATQVLGRSWQSLVDLQRLTPGAMKDAADAAAAYGLVIGSDGVAHAREYEKAQADLSLALLGVKKVVAETLRPAIEFLDADLAKFATSSKADIQSWGDQSLTVFKAVATEAGIIATAIGAVAKASDFLGSSLSNLFSPDDRGHGLFGGASDRESLLTDRRPTGHFTPPIHTPADLSSRASAALDLTAHPPVAAPEGTRSFEATPKHTAKSPAESALDSIKKETDALNLESDAYQKLGIVTSGQQKIAQEQARLDAAGIGSTQAARSAIEGLTGALDKNNAIKAATKTDEETAKLKGQLSVLQASPAAYESEARALSIDNAERAAGIPLTQSQTAAYKLVAEAAGRFFDEQERLKNAGIDKQFTLDTAAMRDQLQVSQLNIGATDAETDARRALSDSLEVERQLREANLDPMSKEGQVRADLIRGKQAEKNATDDLAKAEQTVAGLYDSSLTPLDKYKREMADISIAEKAGAVTAQESAAARTQALNQLAGIEPLWQREKELADSATDAAGNYFENIIQGGAKAKGALKELTADLEKLFLKQAEAGAKDFFHILISGAPAVAGQGAGSAAPGTPAAAPLAGLATASDGILSLVFGKSAASSIESRVRSMFGAGSGGIFDALFGTGKVVPAALGLNAPAAGGALKAVAGTPATEAAKAACCAICPPAGGAGGAGPLPTLTGGSAPPPAGGIPGLGDLSSTPPEFPTGGMSKLELDPNSVTTAWAASQPQINTSLADGVTGSQPQMTNILGAAVQGTEKIFSTIFTSAAQIIGSAISAAAATIGGSAGAGGIGGFLSSLVPGFLGGGGSTDYPTPYLGGSTAGYASGGEFQVGGTGGPDSKTLAGIKVSPGEKVSITPPGSVAGPPAVPSPAPLQVGALPKLAVEPPARLPALVAPPAQELKAPTIPPITIAGPPAIAVTGPEAIPLKAPALPELKIPSPPAIAVNAPASIPVSHPANAPQLSTPLPALALQPASSSANPPAPSSTTTPAAVQRAGIDAAATAIPGGAAAPTSGTAPGGAAAAPIINVHTPPNTTTTTKTNGRDVDIMISEMMAKDIYTNGPLSRALQTSHGLQRTGVGR